MKRSAESLALALSLGMTSLAEPPPFTLSAPLRTPDGHATVTLQAWPGEYRLLASTNLSAEWQPVSEVAVDASGHAQALCLLANSPSLFFRAQGKTPSDGAGCLAQFVTTGSDFSADVRCGSEPSAFAWLWSNGASGTSRPVASVSFGSAGARMQGLLCSPSSAVESINLGFDAADGGGTTPLEHRAAQNVAAVRFPYPLTGLRWWASSYNPITNTLDFSGFSRLEAIECFDCQPLRHVVVTNLPTLARVCFEDCDLRELDLSGNAALGDVRGALNAFTNIVTGRGTGPAIWHWCTRDNPQLTQSFQEDHTNFFALREYFIWNDNQSGALAPVSRVLNSLLASGNHFTSADLSNQPELQSVDLSYNALTNLVAAHSPAIVSLDAHGTRLPAAALDALLAALDAGSPHLSNLNLSQNAQPPTTNGLAHADILAARGVSVQIDRPESSDGRLEVFGGSSAITFVTESETPLMEVRTGAGAATNIVWHWGDGTVVSNALATRHDFGAPGVHTNYVEVLPPDSATYFGAQQYATRQGLRAVYGCANFPNLNFLFLYQESVAELSIAGCAHLTQLHFADNPVSAAVCDQWFLDLDAAVPGPVSNADFYYPSTARTAASDAAWASLVGKGYAMHPF